MRSRVAQHGRLQAQACVAGGLRMRAGMGAVGALHHDSCPGPQTELFVVWKLWGYYAHDALLHVLCFSGSSD